LDNADVLADALGIEIELTAAEHPVGAFSLDLVGRDLTHDCPLIVENQLNATDHDHLGKLITYAAGADAGTVVWVAPEFRDEHRAALDWLNRLGSDRVRFFGVRPGAIRIAGQPAVAPDFVLAVQPNDWSASQSVATRASETDRTKMLRAFWSSYIDRQHAIHPDWSPRGRKQPTGQHYLNYPSTLGWRGHYGVVAARNFLRSELYLIDGSIFPALHSHRAAIEAAYGAPLDWQELPDAKGSRVCEHCPADLADIDRWDEYMVWLLDRQERLRTAMDPVLEEVRRALS
jgi:hypothetical protein